MIPRAEGASDGTHSAIDAASGRWAIAVWHVQVRCYGGDGLYGASWRPIR